MLGRKDACALVARLGGAWADDVNAKTTMLVVGAEGFGPSPQSAQADDGADVTTADSSGVSGSGRTVPETRTVREKSNKLKRVEELNAHQGLRIRIVSEEEFCRLAGVPTPDALKRQYRSEEHTSELQSQR